MNSDQTEKLKGLINSSPILNDDERQEWLTLLGLMNDKQAAELEKILTAAATPASSTVTMSAALGRQSSALGTGGLSGRVGGGQEPTPAGPIVNFPKIREVDSSLPQVERKQQPQMTEPKTSFLGKVQAVLMEKELPPGHPEAVKELELPSPKARTAPAPSMSKGPDRDLQRSNVIAGMHHIQNLPAVFRTKAASPQFPVKDKLPTVPKPPHVKSQTPIETVVAGRPTAKGNVNPSDQKGDKEEQSLGAPFVNQVSQRTLKTGLEKWPEFKQGAMSAGILKTHEGLKLENLSEVCTLSASEFSHHFVEDFEHKLKVLIQKHGYYNVLFNLEKSPLYAAYLNTGMQILSNRSDFEKIQSLENSGHLAERNFLSQSEFENFADLLRRIQTG